MYSSHLVGKIVGKFLCCGLLWATFLSPANADVWNKKTEVTFSAPVEIPGAVLEPGKYVIKLADSSSNRHIVQVLNENENHVYATILAIPNYRLQPTDKTTISFYEMPAGEPKALRAWFYPGDNFGQEFAYPKTRATEISHATNENVPVAPAEMEPKVAEASQPASEPPQSSVASDDSGAANAEPAPTEGETLAQATPPAQATAAEPEQETGKMPATASALPLVGLCGLFSLGAAITLRVFLRRLA